MINKATGNRIQFRQVDSETGDEVPSEDRVKGYKGASGYVLLEPDELDEVALESTHTVDIESFVPRDDIDDIYLDTPYFLFPDDKVGAEAFAVIRDAMAAMSLVGLARVVLHNHERLLMLEPLGKGIKATALRPQEEIRDSDDYFSEIGSKKVSKDMLELAEHILKTKRGHFDPARFSDRYENALKALVKAKQAGKSPPAAPQKPSNVINLMDALRRSVHSDRSRGGDEASRGAKRSASASGKRRRKSKAKRLKRAS